MTADGTDPGGTPRKDSAPDGTPRKDPAAGGPASDGGARTGSGQGAAVKMSKIPLLCATVLVSEVLVIYFAVLVGFGLRPVPFGWVIGGATVIAALCIVAVATLPRRRGQRSAGIALGWLVQMLILAGGFVMTSLFFVGAVFGVMWAVAVYWGRRMDRELTAWGR